MRRLLLTLAIGCLMATGAYASNPTADAIGQSGGSVGGRSDIPVLTSFPASGPALTDIWCTGMGWDNGIFWACGSDFDGNSSNGSGDNGIYFYDVQEQQLPLEKKRLASIRIDGILLDHFCTTFVPHIYAGSQLFGLSVWPQFSIETGPTSLALQTQYDPSWASDAYGGYVYNDTLVGQHRTAMERPFVKAPLSASVDGGCCPEGAEGDGRGRALRRRITLLFAGCAGGLAPCRMTVLRRGAPPSQAASPEQAPVAEFETRIPWIVPALRPSSSPPLGSSRTAQLIRERVRCCCGGAE